MKGYEKFKSLITKYNDNNPWKYSDETIEYLDLIDKDELFEYLKQGITDENLEVKKQSISYLGQEFSDIKAIKVLLKLLNSEDKLTREYVDINLRCCDSKLLKTELPKFMNELSEPGKKIVNSIMERLDTIDKEENSAL